VSGGVCKGFFPKKIAHPTGESRDQGESEIRLCENFPALNSIEIDELALICLRLRLC
jgi:hypothetical protein